MLDVMSSWVLVLPLLVNNIFKPLFRRVGCFCLSLWERSGDKNCDRRTWGETQRREGWQGRERRRDECQMLLGFIWREIGA